MFRIGLFATGRGQGSLQLVTAVHDAIEQGRLPARVEFVFSNREPGEFEPTDRFFEAVRGFGYPLVTRSFRRFKARLRDDPAGWRVKYDHEVIERLEHLSISPTKPSTQLRPAAEMALVWQPSR